MYLDGAIDMAAEAQRISKQMAEVEKYLAGVSRKLANEKFVNNAPAEVVEKERGKHADATARLAKLKATYEFVSGHDPVAQ
jgi:valyl-tRNA synthetase